jgi:hypothetical protein
MTMRNISGAFDSRVDAESARQQVIGVGVAASEVHILEQGSQSDQADGDAPKHQGVWAHIKQMFMPDEDRTAYEGSLRRGGFVLSAAVDDDLADAAIDALESSKAVNLDERQTEWRAKGWTGDSQPTDLGSAREMNKEVSTSDEVIPVVQEPLRVGKREVDRGGLRARSFIVEESGTRDESGAASRSPRGDADKNPN